MSTRGWTIYFAAFFTFAALIGGITWMIAGWAGAGEHVRMVLSGQVPVLALLLLWAVAIFTGRERNG